MAEYIEREDAIRKAKMANHDTNCGYVDWEQDERTELYINEIPAADVRPVVRSRWEYHLAPLALKCAACHKKIAYKYAVESNFCPNCGADMRQD